MLVRIYVSYFIHNVNKISMIVKDSNMITISKLSKIYQEAQHGIRPISKFESYNFIIKPNMQTKVSVMLHFHILTSPTNLTWCF